MNELKEIVESNNIALIKSSAEKYNTDMINVIKFFSDNKIPGVIITLNKPFETMKKILDAKKVNRNLFIFVDGITASIQGKTPENTSECRYIESMKNLTDLAVSVGEAIKSVPSEKKFVLFDSLSTLAIYNNTNTLEKFSHYITTKIRSTNAMGVIFVIEKETDENIMGKLMMFTDKVIETTEGKK